ncbi:hypothetical protein [Actinomadura sp. 3N508]|uniref:hypothetical protein n=1 Tax=Actinomadura sp. 3N508 TaxID=3375153 RepID=UPI0037925C00
MKLESFRTSPQSLRVFFVQFSTAAPAGDGVLTRKASAPAAATVALMVLDRMDSPRVVPAGTVRTAVAGPR